ncbi:hypothetical protein ACFQDF_00595 [Ectobacillus funiculus]|uniref:Uncharacterized protein n=1 Tax=Ectobacillus funiculus TaxID=137993 RepID=A0ABV5WQX4_9BACI
MEWEALQGKYFVSKAKRVELYGEELSRLKENDTFDDMLASFDEVIVELN